MSTFYRTISTDIFEEV